MKTKLSVRLICLIVAAVVLGGAVAVAAALGSPYETLKRAVLQAAAYTNVTTEMRNTLLVNGEMAEQERSRVVAGESATLTYHYDENGELSSYSYQSNGLSLNTLSHFTSEDGTEWHYAYVSPPSERYKQYNNWLGYSADDLGSARMRFFELAVDTLVGDLKNNLTMSTDGGIRTIRGTLTGSQLPELAKAAIDMFVEQTGDHYWNRVDIGFDGSYYVYDDISIRRGEKTVTRWREPVRAMTAGEELAMNEGTIWEEFPDVMLWGYNQYEADGPTYILEGPREQVSEYKTAATRADFADRGALDIPMSSLSLGYVRGEAQIDANGNLLSVDVSGAATITTIFGDVQEVQIDASIHFTDIGTSAPEVPIPGAAWLLTGENMKALFGTDHVSVYFTLDENGAIDEYSMTTTHPAELEKLGYSGMRAYTYGPSGGAIALHRSPASPFLSSSITVGVDDVERVVIVPDPPPPSPLSPYDDAIAEGYSPGEFDEGNIGDDDE